MADIKTILRELSVPCQIYLLYENLDQDIFKPNIFYQIGSHILINKNDSVVQNQLQKINQISNFSDDLKQIIDNGIKLGNLIFSKQEFNFKSNLQIEWKGCYEDDNIIDIVINQYLFSLKEESFILKNMGLYQYINLITDTNKERGLHIFKEYAFSEFQEWFNITWQKLLEYLSIHQRWEFNHKGKTIYMELKNNQIILSYDNFTNKLNIDCSVENFESQTNSEIREQVFAKWINQYLKNDQDYIKIKQKCAEVAGKNLVNFLTKNKSTTQKNLRKLLQISSTTYYFAKTTKQEQLIYKVLSTNDFSDLISIKSINYSVPRSQLNILTEIENKNTQEVLTLRNELRYSHGQFNGVPEAKMYYNGERTTGLEVFYQLI